jgi:hypothetical protein
MKQELLTLCDGSPSYLVSFMCCGFFLSLLGDAPTNPFKYISPKDAMIMEQVSKFPAGFLLAHLAKGNMSFCHHLASVVR